MNTIIIIIVLLANNIEADWNIKLGHKAPKSKKSTKSTKIFSYKSYTKNWSREIFIIDSVLKN